MSTPSRSAAADVKGSATAAAGAPPAASQTLLRGLEIIESVADGCTTLPALSKRTGLTSSTAHRLASALVQMHYLKFEPRKGYSLGSKLIELGFLAYRQTDLTGVARPYLEKLALETHDTVHLAVADNGQVLYLEKLPGQRSVEVSSRIGGRKPLCSTGVGKALLLDHSETAWRQQFDRDCAPAARAAQGKWLKLMRAYADGGYAYDLGEDAPGVRCVAAPIRDATGGIVAALSVSSAVEYMNEKRMQKLVPAVLDAARGISEEMGARREVR